MFFLQFKKHCLTLNNNKGLINCKKTKTSNLLSLYPFLHFFLIFFHSCSSSYITFSFSILSFSFFLLSLLLFLFILLPFLYFSPFFSSHSTSFISSSYSSLSFFLIFLPAHLLVSLFPFLFFSFPPFSFFFFYYSLSFISLRSFLPIQFALWVNMGRQSCSKDVEGCASHMSLWPRI